ncbi:hypothetical protein [Leeuwenhoekiella marinoflava]|uniref:Uncharacterized protein n=2 Tax=Leeuwenhoekiella marinoflava TaxID=988 RepID=A0A4Q0PNE8_9FLAO|nr:hypothetical protein [Leeuwenhoekiella marinoflava]RXG32050.1 hypothetical protein DSL99_1355 [Leeuwenhoekiella marinoflava]SHE96170.1 hypothetical protein SAMN02745246_01410 [Leeuwenhoekiella marinoflava DSM 3653]
MGWKSKVKDFVIPMRSNAEVLGKPRKFPEPDPYPIKLTKIDLNKVQESWLEYCKKQEPISVTHMIIEGQQRKLEFQVLEQVSGDKEISYKEVQRLHHVDFPMKYLLVYKGQTLGMISFDMGEGFEFKAVFNPDVKYFENE